MKFKIVLLATVIVVNLGVNTFAAETLTLPPPPDAATETIPDTIKAPVKAPVPVIAKEAVTDSTKDWVGRSNDTEFQLDGLAGLGVVDNSIGFALMGAVSKRILERGFVADINDSVFIETELGPMFTSGTALFMYSLHLRWDFQLNPDWAFFAIGGLAGDIYSGSNGNSTASGSHFELYPRFGIGAFWQVAPQFRLRAEISHELIVAGASFPF